MTSYYVMLKTESRAREHLRYLARTADHWKSNNGIERIGLDVSDFDGDEGIQKLIAHFGAQDKLSIFRFLPNTCHSWHTDLQRFAAINMLLDGWDSLTLFGKNALGVNLTDIAELTYAPSRYYLLNSKAKHTIINFDNMRYLVSIGIPPQHQYLDVMAYIEKERT